jgi:hypothetical protein
MQNNVLLALIVILTLTQAQIIPLIQPVKLIEPIRPIGNLILATQNA